MYVFRLYGHEEQESRTELLQGAFFVSSWTSWETQDVFETNWKDLTFDPNWQRRFIIYSKMCPFHLFLQTFPSFLFMVFMWHNVSSNWHIFPDPDSQKCLLENSVPKPDLLSTKSWNPACLFHALTSNRPACLRQASHIWPVGECCLASTALQNYCSQWSGKPL